jgi:hypothetical protein
VRDFTEGVLEGLAYSLKTLKASTGSKAAATIRGRILEILEGNASDFEYRLRAVA